MVLASSHVPAPVYPRWRGEHVNIQIYGRQLYGLSPLARGTRNPVLIGIESTRFIPAGAGNTLLILLQYSTVTVYPRWCGEHPITMNISGARCGLSPLARGTHRQKVQKKEASRFIPAGAGNTSAISEILNPWPVYPRWRGEHIKGASTYGNPVGLSPLARGTLQ